jgi:type I restriction enzyme, S subunit
VTNTVAFLSFILGIICLQSSHSRISTNIWLRGIVKPDQFHRHQRFREVGDVVLTTEAPLGEVAQIKTKDKIALAQRVITLRGKQGTLDNTFLKYFLQSPVGQGNLRARESGTTVTGIKQSELRKVELYAPDFTEQRRIADLLSVLDDKIELNLKMSATLDAIAQTIFRRWFIDFQFPGFAGELIEGLPTGWKRVKLKDVIEIKHGFAFKGEFFSDEVTRNILLTPGNFKIGGGFSGLRFKYYQGEVPEEYVLRKNDLIVTMTDLSKAGDTLGYPALTPEVSGKQLLHNQRLGRVLFKTTSQLRSYLFWVMRQREYRYFVLGSATGSTVKHTSPSRICDYEIILPDDNTLKEFETSLMALLDRDQNNSVENHTLTELRQRLLPGLMSGRIRIAE